MENNWKFHHMAVVVRDMDKAVEYYQSLGIATFQPEFMLDSNTYTDYKVYGKTPDTIDKTRMRFVQISSFQLELVQPVEGETIYKEFLKSKGEGVHHIAYIVDDLEGETAKLAKKVSQLSPGYIGVQLVLALLTLISVRLVMLL